MRNTGLLIFLAVFSLCLFKQNTAQAAALIKNPGFEDTLNYWDDLGGAPTQLSNTVFRNGQYSAYKYVDTVAERDYWSQIYQEVLNFKPGQPVYARIYVKTTLSPEATAKAGLMLQFMDNSDNVLGDTLTSRAVGGNTNWRMLELTAQAAPAGTTKARLSGYIWAMQGDNISKTGEAYYDDAYMVKQYRALQLQKGVYNAGFENGLNDWTEMDGWPAFLTRGIVYAGTYAAGKEIVTVTNRDYWSRIYQEVACSSGKTLTAKLMVKPQFDKLSLAKVGLEIEFFDANSQSLSKVKKQLGGTSSTWRQLSISVTSTPANCVKVRFSIFVYAPMGNVKSVGGKGYFDNAKLTITTPTP